MRISVGCIQTRFMVVTTVDYNATTCMLVMSVLDCMHFEYHGLGTVLNSVIVRTRCSLDCHSHRRREHSGKMFSSLYDQKSTFNSRRVFIRACISLWFYSHLCEVHLLRL